MKIKLEVGTIIEVKQHPFSGKEVKHRHSGLIGVVLGIRSGAKDARERHAFVIEYKGGVFVPRRVLISRVNFEVI